METLEEEIAVLKGKVAEESALVEEFTRGIAKNKQEIIDCEDAIAKYQKQLDGISNSREYDSLNKEIENQDLLRQIAEKNISEMYRSDPINGSSKQHTGMDFACKPGNIVRATGDGVVEKAEFETGYGNSIVIYHGYGYRTRYAHLSRIDVEPGQVLTRGNKIGATGASGRVTGPHLHYEVLYGREFVNPADYMDLDMSPKST